MGTGAGNVGIPIGSSAGDAVFMGNKFAWHETHKIVCYNNIICRRKEDSVVEKRFVGPGANKNCFPNHYIGIRNSEYFPKLIEALSPSSEPCPRAPSRW